MILQDRIYRKFYTKKINQIISNRYYRVITWFPQNLFGYMKVGFLSYNNA